MSSLFDSGRPKGGSNHTTTILLLVILLAFLLILFVVGSIVAYIVLSDGTTTTTTTTTTSSTTSSSTTSSTSSTTSTVRSTTTRATTTVPPTTLPEETCSDGIRNQGETGVDCGGPCQDCEKSPGQVAVCLSTKNLKLYLRNNEICRKCKSIRDYLGSSIAYLDVTDCDDDDNEDDCEDMLDEAEDQDVIRGYPMWEINGELYPGYTVDAIKSLTGCF